MQRQGYNGMVSVHLFVCPFVPACGGPTAVGRRCRLIAAWRALNSSGGQCDIVCICSKLKGDLLKLLFVVMAWFVAGFDTLASLLSQSDMPLFRAEEAKVCTMMLCYCEYMQSLLSGRHWVSFSVAETKF